MKAGWSAKMLEEVANMQDHKGTDDMMQWIKKSVRKVLMKLRKVLCGNIGDEVLEKYKVEVSYKRCPRSVTTTASGTEACRRRKAAEEDGSDEEDDEEGASKGRNAQKKKQLVGL